MKSYSRFLSMLTLGLGIAASMMSCDDGKSYAELLTDEAHSINRFLADHRVENEIPADTVFEVGEDAPFYRLDADGNFYMQVLDAGTKSEANKVQPNEQIYFRTTRYNLHYYFDGTLPEGDGNASDPSVGNYFFRFENFELQSSSQWGSGIQMPLYYLPVNCEVNIVVKSQYGMTNEVANVIPFMYNIRYYKSPM